MPLLAIVATGIVGFCKILLKPFGPVQLQLVPSSQVNAMEEPAQTGELLLTIGSNVQFEQSGEAPSISI